MKSVKMKQRWFAGTWSWADSISPRADSVGQRASVVRCPPAVQVLHLLRCYAHKHTRTRTHTDTHTHIHTCTCLYIAHSSRKQVAVKLCKTLAWLQSASRLEGHEHHNSHWQGLHFAFERCSRIRFRFAKCATTWCNDTEWRSFFWRGFKVRFWARFFCVVVYG